MTVIARYPNTIINITDDYTTVGLDFTLLVDGTHEVIADHLNMSYAEIVAIETELGADIAGNLTDLKARLAVSLNDDGKISTTEDVSLGASVMAHDAQINIELTNKTGGVVTAGDVVVVDGDNNNAIKYSTILNSTQVAGVVTLGGIADVQIRVCLLGYAAVLVKGTLVRGDLLTHSNENGFAQAVDNDSGANIIGKVLGLTASGHVAHDGFSGFVAALINPSSSVVGISGALGVSGTSGTSGTFGADGGSGTSGWSGFIGTSGWSGFGGSTDIGTATENQSDEPAPDLGGGGTIWGEISLINANATTLDTSIDWKDRFIIVTAVIIGHANTSKDFLPGGSFDQLIDGQLAEDDPTLNPIKGRKILMGMFFSKNGGTGSNARIEWSTLTEILGVATTANLTIYSTTSGSLIAKLSTADGQKWDISFKIDYSPKQNHEA